LLHRQLFFWWSGAFAFFSGVFSFPLNAGFLEELAAAQLGKDSFLLNTLVESPE
jgi:hypothetical protein